MRDLAKIFSIKRDEDIEIKRDIYLNKLISCGKSYLLFNLFKNHLLEEGVDEQHIIEIAFDTFENKRFREPDVLYP